MSPHTGGRSILVVAAAMLMAFVGTAQAQAPAAPAPARTRWLVDIAHSQIDFRVRHLVGRVRGTFTNWYAQILTQDTDWAHGRVNVVVQTASLNTGNGLRDDDLRSNRFFGVDSFPEMKFEGTGLQVSDTTVEITGLLTIKGHTLPVTLKGGYRGIAKDQDGHERIAFDATTNVDRRNFGIQYNKMVGQIPLIGNDVEITIALEAVRQ
jgi:polyisoprenoid-binding protein YceI